MVMLHAIEITGFIYQIV